MTVRAMFLAMSSVLAASPTLAAPPSKNDYASGMSVEAPYSQPMIEAVLPEEVYRTVTATISAICAYSMPKACRCRTRFVPPRKLRIRR